MNAHQRKKTAVRRHYTMPLGSPVLVKDRGETFHGQIGKHDRGNRCIVHFPVHNRLSLAVNKVATQPFAWVTYYSVRPVEVNRVRPWWRELRERRREGTKS